MAAPVGASGRCDLRTNSITIHSRVSDRHRFRSHCEVHCLTRQCDRDLLATLDCALCPRPTFQIWTPSSPVSPPYVLSNMALLFILFLRALIFTITFPFSIATLGCIKEFGTGINPQHCEEAMKNFYALSSFHSAGGGLHDEHWFSRNLGLVDTFRHLPKAFVFKTCSIGVDLSDRPHPPSNDSGRGASWAVFAEEVHALIKSCPERHGWGGIAIYQDFEFVIVNPAAGIAQDTCLTPHRHHGMSLSKCIERQVRAKQQQVRQQMRPHTLPLPTPRGAQQPPSRSGAQRPPLFESQVYGGAGWSTAPQPPAPQPPATQQLAGPIQRFQSARQFQGGQQVTDHYLRQQAQRIFQQMSNTAQLQAHDRAQQEGDRRAQRQALSAPRPPLQMAQQQPPPHSQGLTVAPLQLGQQPQGSNAALLMGYLSQAAHLAQQSQQPQPAAQTTGSASPTPGSSSTVTERSSSRQRHGGSGARSPGADA